MTHGEMLATLGLDPQCDGGGVHVMPVPRSMTIDQVIAELRTLGRLAEVDPDCSWATVECPGSDDCWCQHNEISPDFVWRHGDEVIWPVAPSDEVRRSA